MVADPPLFRMALVVIIATGARGRAVRAAGGGPAPAARRIAAALAAFLLAAALALAAAGLPVRLLPPGAWDELGAELDRGLSGIRTVEWPYAGDEDWVRLVILLGRPGRARARGRARVLAGPARPRRCCAPSAWSRCSRSTARRSPSTTPARRWCAASVLFLLVAAWLWLPRLKAKEARAAALTVLAVGVLALPAAARLDAEDAVDRLPSRGTGSAART